MNDLERQYRAALRYYPRRWRSNHEDALVGLLLDAAEAEGRVKMSSAERFNLAFRAARLWVSRATAVALFAIALVLSLFTASIAINGGGFDSEMVLSLPPIPAPPIGGSYIPLLVTQQPGWVVYLFTSITIVVTALSGTLLTLRNQKTDRGH